MGFSPSGSPFGVHTQKTGSPYYKRAVTPHCWVRISEAQDTHDTDVEDNNGVRWGGDDKDVEDDDEDRVRVLMG
jgi:hypothetical protein